jgi:hypothetical protein
MDFKRSTSKWNMSLLHLNESIQVIGCHRGHATAQQAKTRVLSLILRFESCSF